jgi:hypothetical protein
MQVPSFVRRATLRVIAGGVAAAVVTAALGLGTERLRFGGTLDAASGTWRRPSTSCGGIAPSP